MRKPIFQPRKTGQVSTWYLFTKTDRFPLILKSSQNDEILWRHFAYFLLPDWHNMRGKKTIEISTIYWNVPLWLFQTDVLTFSSPSGGLKRLHVKISSWQSGIPAVQKGDPALPGWNFLHEIARYNLWRSYNTTGIRARWDRISSRPTRIM